MTTNLHHYYHIYAAEGGLWIDPANNHFIALEQTGLLDALSTFRVGIVGTQENRDWVKSMLPPFVKIAAEADEGYEQVTLFPLQANLIKEPGYYLYAHTKGAGEDTLQNYYWRHGMTGEVIGGWQRCVALLTDYEAVGCHWQLPSPVNGPIPYFAGNFWWATSEYLLTLPAPSLQSRYEAENWVGRGDPTVYDLRPVPPDYSLQINPMTGRPFMPQQERVHQAPPEKGYPSGLHTTHFLT